MAPGPKITCLLHNLGCCNNFFMPEYKEGKEQTQHLPTAKRICPECTKDGKPFPANRCAMLTKNDVNKLIVEKLNRRNGKDEFFLPVLSDEAIALIGGSAAEPFLVAVFNNRMLMKGDYLVVFSGNRPINCLLPPPPPEIINEDNNILLLNKNGALMYDNKLKRPYNYKRKELEEPETEKKPKVKKVKEEDSFDGILLKDLKEAKAQIKKEEELEQWMAMVEMELEEASMDEYESDDDFWSELSSDFAD